MAIVMTIDNGPRSWKAAVDDRYCVKTKEEVDHILRKCSRIYAMDKLKQEIKKEEQEYTS